MPPLDVLTLVLVSSLVLGAMGLSFVVKWWDDRGSRELLDWGIGFLAVVPGVILIGLRGHVSDTVSIAAANAMVVVGYGFLHAGAVRFVGRRPILVSPVMGAAVWLLLCSFPDFLARFDLRVVTVSVLCGAYCLSAARALHRHRRVEDLPSLRRVVAALAIVSGLMWTRAALMAVWPIELVGHAAISSAWLTWLALALLVMSLICAQFLLTMSSERAALNHRRAAERDDLTGIPTRRSFVEGARERLARHPERGTLMFFDIDHFKTINDTHGHAVGDEVLVAFVRSVERRLGPDDLFARWGGEEFVLFAVDRDFVAGRRIAEEIRRDFAAMTIEGTGRLVGATVSVGLAAPALTGPDLDHLIACADAGVYAAKRAGRDRVETVTPRSTARQG